LDKRSRLCYSNK